jgi:group I intron endonuclease
MKGFIYKITNPNGRVYIGQTKNFKKRKSYYSASMNGQPLLQRSIAKYGYESHSFEVIDECECDINNNSLDELEIYWINEYKSNHIKYPENLGMNLTDGGGGRFGYKLTEETKLKISKSNKGKKLTEETKLKISQSHTGKKIPDEVKKKISNSTKGEKSHLYGKEKSPEIKEKLRKANLGKISSKRKKVEAYNYLTGEYIGTYDSFTECQKELGLHNHITDVILGKYKQYKGYTFKLAQDDNIDSSM